MASWLIPAIKAVLPHVGDILGAAKPAFTKRKPEAAANQADLVQQQIAELQAAIVQGAGFSGDTALNLGGVKIAAVGGSVLPARFNVLIPATVAGAWICQLFVVPVPSSP